MTDSRFKSLSIGDRVRRYDIPSQHLVTNQFIRVLDGVPTSFIHLSYPDSPYPLVVPEYRAFQYEYLGGGR